MAFIGGDLLEITVTSETYGSRTFKPMSGEAGTFDPGGVRNDDESNGVTGNGTSIWVKKNNRWSVEQVCALSLNEDEDVHFIANLAAETIEQDWTFQHISGAIHAGKGQPVGDIQGDYGAATFTLKASGGGSLAKI